MATPKKISGFTEWLPEERIVEEGVIERIREIYMSHGFVPIETPAIELISTLSSKGVVDKEIFAVRRAKADPGEDSELALHFDLTVPFARYVAQHFQSLTFPFKRYQIQKVWRGERPQRGRAREFYQFDIDIIAREELPLAADAEVLTVVSKVFRSLHIGPFTIRINSRKLLSGLYEAVGLSPEQTAASIRIVDKLDKIGHDGVAGELAAAGIDDEQSRKVLDLTAAKFAPGRIAEEVPKLVNLTPSAELGLRELTTIIDLIPESCREEMIVDLSLARGLDYYTGLVGEVTMDGHPEYGSVCGGGRYDDLASQFTSQRLPGVGFSVGLTRLMDLVFSKSLIGTEKKTRTQVLITVLSEDLRKRCNEVAEKLRTLGVKTEVYFKSPKLGKQIEYADSLGIRWIMFLRGDSDVIEIKDLRSKEQSEISDLDGWANLVRQG